MSTQTTKGLLNQAYRLIEQAMNQETQVGTTFSDEPTRTAAAERAKALKEVLKSIAEVD